MASTLSRRRLSVTKKKVAEIKDFLAKHPKKCGPTGNEQKSNLTDPRPNASACHPGW
jgi:hypothetical protein